MRHRTLKFEQSYRYKNKSRHLTAFALEVYCTIIFLTIFLEGEFAWRIYTPVAK